jgi:hypothetical protein
MAERGGKTESECAAPLSRSMSRSLLLSSCFDRFFARNRLVWKDFRTTKSCSRNRKSCVVLFAATGREYGRLFTTRRASSDTRRKVVGAFCSCTFCWTCFDFLTFDWLCCTNQINLWVWDVSTRSKKTRLDYVAFSANTRILFRSISCSLVLIIVIHCA